MKRTFLLLAAVAGCAGQGPPPARPAPTAPSAPNAPNASTAPSAPSAPSAPNDQAARAAFAELKGLVGDWQGTTSGGRVLKVSYQLLANDAALVETWSLAPGRLSLTVYHLSGPDLLATHYCPLGNQPRLRLASSPRERTYAFEFVDATNLKGPGAAHQQRFEVEVVDRDRFRRSETYRENGKDEAPELVTYARAAPADRR